MRYTKIKPQLLIGLTALLLLTSSTSLAKPTQKFSLNFEAKVGGKPFSCGQSYEGIGLSKSRITPSDLRFYISNVELIDTQGNSIPLMLDQDGIWQYQNIALLDFENGTGPCINGNIGLHTSITGTAPKNHYQGLRLTLGIPDDLNHGNAVTAPAPLNITSMFWTWRAGYKFVKLDMATSAFPQLAKQNPTRNNETGNEAKSAATLDKNTEDTNPTKTSGFAIHIGSTSCASPSRTIPPIVCHNPNLVTIDFDEFNATKDIIIVDLAQLLFDTNLDYHAPNSAPGCMSDPNDEDCKSIMAGFGLPFNQQPAYPQHFLTLKSLQ
jgi:uncharacterized repeat protein (TIGR04052 family)